MTICFISFHHRVETFLQFVIDAFPLRIGLKVNPGRGSPFLGSGEWLISQSQEETHNWKNSIQGFLS